jgi:hypothetical protein
VLNSKGCKSKPGYFDGFEIQFEEDGYGFIQDNGLQFYVGLKKNIKYDDDFYKFIFVVNKISDKKSLTVKTEGEKYDYYDATELNSDDYDQKFRLYTKKDLEEEKGKEKGKEKIEDKNNTSFKKPILISLLALVFGGLYFYFYTIYN